MPGGGAVYAALGAALWCGRAAVIAPCGDDYPRERFPTLAFSPSRTAARTMRNWGLYETDGSRHFLSRRDSLPWDAFSSSAADLDGGPYAHAHIAPLPFANAGALIAALRACGARTISIDLHDRELAAVPFDAIAAELAAVDVFLPSRQDTEVLFPGEPPLRALARLRARLPAVPVLGVKSGAAGALVHAAGAPHAYDVPSAAAGVVDVTGAGDAFCGGFLAGYAETRSVLDGALYGAVAASYALAAVGTSALVEAGAADAAARLAALRPRVRTVALDAA